MYAYVDINNHTLYIIMYIIYNNNVAYMEINIQCMYIE